MSENTFTSNQFLRAGHHFKKLCCLIVVLGCFTLTEAQQNQSLNFDGNDDYVDCGNSSSFAATNIKTIECWAKFKNTSGAYELISKSSLGQGIELIVYNNALSLYCMKDGGNYSSIDYPVSNLLPDVWYHIAASFNGTTESMKLYVNGDSVGNRYPTGNIGVTGITDPAGSTLKLGNWSYPGFSRYFPGTLDEVRIWDYQRSTSEIKDGMYGTVAANTPGLIAYYKMNEGTGTLAVNSTPNTGLDGTLTNGPLWAASPVQAGSNAISFDGINDYAIVPSIPAYDFTSGTIECIIKPTSLTGVNDCFLASKGTGGLRYSFHVNSSQIVFKNGTSTQTISAVLTPGTAYHIALVANGTTIDVYVDGVLRGTFNQTFGTVTGQPLLFGSSDPATVGGENFDGTIDEVRLWNTQRTGAEILANKDNGFSGNEAGLIALFNFNQGNTEGDNSGLNVIIDKTPAGNHGLLVNLALAGTTSNYITPPIVLPVRFTTFDLSKNNQSVIVRWQTAQEQNSLRFEIEHGTNGVSFAKIGFVAAAGNSSNTNNYSFTDYSPENGINYYRIRQVDLDGKSDYTPVKTISFSNNTELSWSLMANRAVDVKLLNGSNERYQLYDMTGRSIKTGNLNSGHIQFNNLQSGRYTIQVEAARRLAIAFIVP